MQRNIRVIGILSPEEFKEFSMRVVVKGEKFPHIKTNEFAGSVEQAYERYGKHIAIEFISLDNEDGKS